MKCPNCNHEFTPTKTALASEMGRKGGSSTSKKKRAASKRNGFQATKLNEGDRQKIFDKLETGISQKQIAKEFKVSESYISKLKKRFKNS